MTGAPRAVVPLLSLCLLSLVGCGQSSDARREHAPQAGSYAVATPPAALSSTPVAAEGHYQVVSAGDPVRVELPDAGVVAQLSGPDVVQPTDPKAGSAPAVATVSLRSERGSLLVPASSFLALNRGQDPLALHPDARAVTVSPGHPATLRLSSAFPAGHATITWQPTGHPLVTWDFVIEID